MNIWMLLAVILGLRNSTQHPKETETALDLAQLCTFHSVLKFYSSTVREIARDIRILNEKVLADFEGELYAPDLLNLNQLKASQFRRDMEKITPEYRAILRDQTEFVCNPGLWAKITEIGVLQIAQESLVWLLAHYKDIPVFPFHQLDQHRVKLAKRVLMLREFDHLFREFNIKSRPHVIILMNSLQDQINQLLTTTISAN